MTARKTQSGYSATATEAAQEKALHSRPGVPVVEICIEDARDAGIARDAGADRIELARDLWCGGLTPKPQEILDAIAEAPAGGVRVLVREREEGFALSDAEVDELATNVAEIRSLVADSPAPVGFVIGAVTAEKDGEVNVAAARKFREAAGNHTLVFHRAFDEVADQTSALEQLIQAGFDGVLTTGGQSQASVEGLRALVNQSAGRIEIIASGGLREHNANEVVQATGAREVHMRAPLSEETITRETTPAKTTNKKTTTAKTTSEKTTPGKTTTAETTPKKTTPATTTAEKTATGKTRTDRAQVERIVETLRAHQKHSHPKK